MTAPHATGFDAAVSVTVASALDEVAIKVAALHDLCDSVGCIWPDSACGHCRAVDEVLDILQPYREAT